jgi:hypothetical protein
MKQRLVTAIAVTLLAGVVAIATPVRAATPSCNLSDPLCYQPAAEKLIEKINAVTEPSVAVPAWLE